MEYQIDPDEPVTTAVHRAIEQSAECESNLDKPLFEVVNPDALNALFAPVDSDTSSRGGRVSFVYGDCRITVENAEHLTVNSITNGGY